MQQTDPSSSPEGSDRARRRGFFSKGNAGPPEPSFPDDRTQAVVSAYQAIVMDRLDKGMHEIQRTADLLMHEIAGEVWRTAGGSKGEVQAKILESLSRDQAIRSLIAHSDERFQDIAIRTERLEGAVTELTESTRFARDAIGRGVEALRAATGAPGVTAVTELRQQLEQLTRQMVNAIETLAERDRLIVETIRERVGEHGELVAQETSRIAEAVQAYVEQGVSAMGHLAGRVETQVERMASHEEIDGRLSAVVEEQTRALAERMSAEVGEQTRALAERMSAEVGEQTHLLAEELQLAHERVGMGSRDAVAAIERLDAHARERLLEAQVLSDEALKTSQEAIEHAFEARLMGLAQLVRSDSEALRTELVRTAAAQDESMARRMDEGLGRVSEALSSATRWLIEELTKRIHEETGRAVQQHLEETGRAVQQHLEESGRVVQQHLEGAVGTIDRNMVRMSETLDTQLDRLGRTVGQQAAEASERAVGARLAASLDELSEARGSIERVSADISASQRDAQETLARSFDVRIASLAKMIRSDNQALAERVQIAAEQDSSKQALRAIKELQANLPSEMVDIVDRRVREIAEQLHRDVQATAESVAKVGDVLENKFERATAQIAERYDNDIQNVIDRMGDAMHALASLGRSKPDRIELE